MTEKPSALRSAVAAVSTPPGKGGVAVIRISGADARQIADGIFFPKSQKPLTSYPPRTQVYGEIRREDRRIDDGMATFFEAPHSFTGEDTAEISCHGGILVTAAVLETALLAGARMAEPGEFTRRAFLNGKLSLPEAEAIGDLLEAQSMSQVRLAAGEGKDRLAAAYAEIREELTAALGSIFARIDYPDEDLGELSIEEILRALRTADEKAGKLLDSYRTGRAVRFGIETAIVGKPNVGKSTLYNALLGRDAAIVTEIPGTTRDVLTEAVSLGEVMLRLSDTAGMREATDDPIEAIGVQRSKDKLASAELILALFDPSRPTDEEDGEVLRKIAASPAEKILIFTKSDLPEAEGFDRAAVEKLSENKIEISAKALPDEAREQLQKRVGELFTDGSLVIGQDAVLSSARQHAALRRAKDHLEAAIAAFSSGVEEDAAASELESALSAIAELDGRAVTEEVVANIFSRFCVGK